MLYLRISADPKNDELGVRRQEKELRALAERLGWEIIPGVAGVYSDDDRSAYNGKPRERFEDLLADLRLGVVDGVLCWHSDRLYRRPRDLDRLIDVLEVHDTQVQTVKSGIVDLSNATGRAVAKTIAVWSEHESALKAERLMSKHDQMRQAGQPVGGGPRAYGWRSATINGTKTSVLEPTEAQVLRDAATRILHGEKLGTITRDLNERGVATATGAPWNPSSLKAMLVRPRVVALAGSGKDGMVPVISEETGEPVRAAWPAILDMDTWQSVRAILLDADRRTNTGRVHTRLLPGFLFCTTCAGPMQGRPPRARRMSPHGRWESGRAAKYGCVNPKCRVKANTLQDETEKLVTSLVAVWLAEQEFPDQAPPADDPIAADITAFEAQAAHYRELMVTRAMAEEDALPAINLVRAKIQALKAKQAQTAKRRTRPLPSAEQWLNLHGLTERRAVLSDVITRIDVKPGPWGDAYHPDRIHITFRDDTHGR